MKFLQVHLSLSLSTGVEIEATATETQAGVLFTKLLQVIFCLPLVQVPLLRKPIAFRC